MNARKNQKSIKLLIPVVLTFSCACLFIFSVPVLTAQGNETRGYVISMVHTATYVDAQTCPQGTNGLPPDILLRRVIGAGYSEEEAYRILTGGNGGRDDDGNRVGEARTLGGGGAGGGVQGWNGLDFNPANIPGSLPDPNAISAQGRFALGLNLDGEIGPDSWEHPETGQQGIDNQMWRVLGCWDVYNVNKPVLPYNESIVWDTAIDAMPAWLVSVSGENLSQDGEVTVTFDRALNILLRDAYGSVMTGATFAVDTNPRSHNVFAGHIEDRVLTIEPGDFFMQGESQFYSHLEFTGTQLRLEMDADGSMRGHIGGYQPWRDYYHFLSVRGETDGMVDLPGVFYAMKRFADASPDPTTGENTAISSAYFIEAVPAFHVNAAGELLAESVGKGPKFSGPAVSQYGNNQ